MNYRKRYELFYGPIPKDDDGRTYDIHHIDGDRTNNSILNLVALSIKDHYDVHYYQGDYGACVRIACKMSRSTEEISELASKQQKELVETGKHHFLKSEVQSKINHQKVKNGTNPWAGEQGKQRSKNLIQKRIAEGTFHFIGKNNPVYKQIEEGRHPLALYAKNQKTITCPVCRKTMNEGNYIRWKHGENCSKIPTI